MLDYLVEEVLSQQSESLQNFLLQTSVLGRMTGSLCDAITLQDNGDATLEALDRANLFIVPLDEERRWYRYHHLFADLLLRRLKALDSDLVPVLHRRASQWYELSEAVDEAIGHALIAGDFHRAVLLVENVAHEMWERGEDSTLSRWLEKLPVELLQDRPQLCVFHAWGLFATGQQASAEWCLEVAEQALIASEGVVAVRRKWHGVGSCHQPCSGRTAREASGHQSFLRLLSWRCRCANALRTRGA